jgi:4-amino-4-deoxy-L-arabinose transferase-like glycosyltransferase
MKEDAALVFGLGCSVLGLAMLDQWRRAGWPTWAALVMTAVGCGLAASAKYIGAVMIAPVLVYLAIGPAFRRRLRVAACLVLISAAVGVFAAINFEAVLDPDTFMRGVRYEWHHVTSDHQGLISDRCGLFGSRVVWHETTLPVLLAAAGFALWIVAGAGRRSLLDWLLLLIPIGAFVVVATSPVQIDRYFLPVVVWLHLLAGLAIGGAADWLCRRQAAGVTAAAMLVIVPIVVAGRLALSATAQFGDDSRDRVRQFLLTHLGPDETVAADELVELYRRSMSESGIRVRLMRTREEAVGLQRLEAEDVTHVVICNTSYDRFLFEQRRPTDGARARVGTNAAMYRALLERGNLVWQSPPASPMPYYVNPEIRVYRLPVPAEETDQSD